MARVEYVQPHEATAEVAALYDAGARVGGRVTNFHKILGHVPWMYKWHIPMQASVNKGDLGRISKRLAILLQIRTSVVNACEYCTHHTIGSGNRIGLTDDEVVALQNDPSSCHTFTDAEKAALHWAESVATNAARRDMDGFAELQRHFNDSEIVEITVIIAMRTMVNRVQEALWTDVEEEGELPDANISAQAGDLEWYVDEVICTR